MKTRFLLSFKFKKIRTYCALIYFLFVVQNISFAQYIPIPTDTTAIWRVDWYDYKLCGPNQPNASYQYCFTGDTTINSIVYSKLFTSGYTQCLHLGFMGSLRNDSVNQKVYFIEADSSNEKLLYDFNPAIGDTVPQLYPASFITVGYIDTVVIDGLSRKRIYHDFLPASLGPFIIEGIGSTNGLLAQIDAGETRFDLICFSHENRLIFPDTATTCSIYDDINQINFNSETIIPNPIHEQSLLSSKKIINQINLFNIEGNNVANYIVNSKTYILDRGQLKNGVYFLEILYDDNSFRFIKVIIL